MLSAVEAVIGKLQTCRRRVVGVRNQVTERSRLVTYTLKLRQFRVVRPLLRRQAVKSLLRVAAGFLFVSASVGCLASDGVDVGGGEPGEGGGEPVAGSGGESVGGAGNEGGSQIPAEEDPFEPPPVPSTFTNAELADLKSDIDAALAGASATYSARVVGLDSGQIVYEKNATTLKKPASNTKLFSTAVALVLGGEAGRPSAGLYGTLDGNVVTGDLVLFGAHDPVTTTSFGASSRQSLDAAAELLSEKGVTQISGGVVARGEFLYEGNSLGTMDFATERAQTASAFRAALVAAGISVAGGAGTSTSLEPPADLDLVLPMPSASLDVIANAINVPSHNEMADLLMHHLGIAEGGASSYASGFATVSGVLDDIGASHEGLILNDGSGLSHDNRVSATHITSLFQAMAQRADWSAYVHSMAIAGVRGTIGSRMTGENTNGRFWGKTGTLTGVVALSGVLFHRHDGQRYVVSLLANDVGNSTSARAALDAAVGALASNRKGQTGLLPAPALVRVSDDGNGETALVELEPVDGASSYLLWRSADGQTWRREDARLIEATQHRTFMFDGSLFVRVTALSEAGEGVPSSVLAVRSGDAKTLFVDGNERYAAAPVGENPMGWGNDAAVLHALAISGGFESCSAQQVESGAVDLADFDRVVWALGRESSADETFSGGEQPRVKAFVDGGGRLFVSGAEVGYDLLAEGSAEDAAFANDVLGIDYVSDDAGTTFLTAGEVPLDVGLARFSKLGRHETTFPDVLAPVGGGSSCLRYAAGVAGDACVLSDTPSGGRVIVLGLPLESVDDPTVAAALLALL